MNESEKAWSGTARVESFVKPNAGQELRVESRLSTFHPGPRIAEAQDLGALQGVLLQLHIAYEGQLLPYASAVMVAPGVAVTATHTFLDYVEEGTDIQKFSVHGLAPLGDRLILWIVRKMTFVPGDISILEFDLLSEEAELADEHGKWQLPFAAMCARPPSIGERLVIAGFRAAEQHYQQGMQMEGGLALLVAQGPVTAFYPVQRDTVMLPFPCIEVDCPAMGAMSGGAVFNQDGFLIGVLSSSIEGPTVLEGGPSYAAWLVPALPQAFGGGWPPNLVDGSNGLLAKKSFAVVRNAEAFMVDLEAQTWSYEFTA